MIKRYDVESMEITIGGETFKLKAAAAGVNLGDHFGELQADHLGDFEVCEVEGDTHYACDPDEWYEHTCDLDVDDDGDFSFADADELGSQVFAQGFGRPILLSADPPREARVYTTTAELQADFGEAESVFYRRALAQLDVAQYGHWSPPKKGAYAPGDPAIGSKKPGASMARRNDRKAQKRAQELAGYRVACSRGNTVDPAAADAEKFSTPDAAQRRAKQLQKSGQSAYIFHNGDMRWAYRADGTVDFWPPADDTLP